MRERECVCVYVCVVAWEIEKVERRCRKVLSNYTTTGLAPGIMNLFFKFPTGPER